MGDEIDVKLLFRPNTFAQRQCNFCHSAPLSWKESLHHAVLCTRWYNKEFPAVQHHHLDVFRQCRLEKGHKASRAEMTLLQRFWIFPSWHRNASVLLSKVCRRWRPQVRKFTSQQLCSCYIDSSVPPHYGDAGGQ